MKKINLAELASYISAYNSCKEDFERTKDRNKRVWAENWADKINELLEDLPSGSGIDRGTKFDWIYSTNKKIIFTLGFHHMDEHGGYDCWTEHKITLTPTFGSFDMKIAGRNHNDIKDYLADIFNELFYVSEKDYYDKLKSQTNQIVQDENK